MDGQYIDLNELSTRTGVSPRTLRKWVRDPARRLPAYHVGGKFLFSWREIELWLQEFRVTPVDTDAIADTIEQLLTEAQE